MLPERYHHWSEGELNIQCRPSYILGVPKHYRCPEQQLYYHINRVELFVDWCRVFFQVYLDHFE